MASYPNPYSSVIASFNRQSPADKVQEGQVPGDGEDEDDPQHLPDDDLLLWANAQFTFDNQTPGAGSYEDELALNIAQSQHQQLQAQQFQLLQQHHHHQQHQQIQNGQFQQHPNLQPQANALLPSIPLQSHLQRPQHIQHPQHPQHPQHSQHLPHSQQHGSSHVLQSYHPAEMQRQLQQFDAIHGYLDGTTEDPRSSLSLVERSRQRNPVTPGAMPQQQQLQQQQQPLQNQPFDSRLLHSVYAQQQQQQQQQPAASSSAGSHHQAMMSQQPLHQHFQPYSLGASSAMPSSSLNQFQQPQHHDAQHTATSVSSSNQAGDRMSSSSTSTTTTRTTSTRDRNNSVNVSTLSSLSLHDTSPTAAAAGGTLTSHEEKLLQLETELEVYESELAEERRLQQQQEHQHQQQRQSSADMTDAEGDGGPNDSGNDSSANSAQSPSHGGAAPTSGPEHLDAAARLAAEEDKRRRNTAASARFRHKKRLREQILERTAKEMTAKSEILELRVRELEMEIKWLRGLIVEKDAGRGLLVEGADALAASALSGSGMTSLGTNAAGHLPGLAPRSTGGVESSSGKTTAPLRSKRPQ
ncbi:hypothetical protein EC968_006298 [Mortierella alpina]|nr:hypothetical protein EC968_006298 [Mortierella alpina]